jgi:hypothetical protein
VYDVVLFRKYPRCTFYTVQKPHDANTVFGAFLNSVQAHETALKEFSATIQPVLDLIGKYGAREDYFRDENNSTKHHTAVALPPEPSTLKRLRIAERNPLLRLYLLKLSEGVIVLLGGGVKTAMLAQQCSNVAPHFGFANDAAKHFQDALDTGCFRLEPLALVSESGSYTLPCT